MSWLLVAFVPALLMLATFGLQRLESGLNRDAVYPADVAEFLEQARPTEVRTLATDGMPEALDCFHRRRMQAGRLPALAVRAPGRELSNPRFPATRHADPV